MLPTFPLLTWLYIHSFLGIKTFLFASAISPTGFVWNYVWNTFDAPPFYLLIENKSSKYWVYPQQIPLIENDEDFDY